MATLEPNGSSHEEEQHIEPATTKGEMIIDDREGVSASAVIEGNRNESETHSEHEVVLKDTIKEEAKCEGRDANDLIVEEGADKEGATVQVIPQRKPESPASHDPVDIIANEIEEHKETSGATQNEEVAKDDRIDPSESAISHQDGLGAAAELEPNGASELQRLRDLVFASRGSKGSLPAGWDDEEIKEEKAEQVVPEASKLPDSADSVAQKMLQRAISLVGQLASDSESESDDSSDSDSDSSSSSSSTTSPSSNKRTKKRPVIRDAISSDEEDGGGGGGKGPTTKNEVLEPTVDAPPYTTVPADKEIRSLGKVHSIVDCVVVVAQEVGKAPGQQPQQPRYQAPFDMHGRKGEEEGEYSVLDTGSLLSFSDRNVLGIVYETFGSVLAPLYALRYSSASHINKDMIKIGKEVSYVPSHSTYVLTRALRAMGKGSDASNLWDEEIGDEEREFSDDEAEAAYKKSAKAAKGKGKKRSHPEEGSLPGSGGGSGLSRAIKHSLPSRPTMAPVHRDAAGGNSQTYPLQYDDEEPAPQARPLHLPTQHNAMYQPPSHDAYAQWANQQQQQHQHQQQQPTLPSFHFQHLSYPATQQFIPSSSYYSASSANPSSDSYDPQQPLFGLTRPPPPQPPPHWP